jgi:hypothetical protein
VKARRSQASPNLGTPKLPRGRRVSVLAASPVEPASRLLGVPVQASSRSSYSWRQRSSTNGLQPPRRSGGPRPAQSSGAAGAESRASGRACWRRDRRTGVGLPCCPVQMLAESRCERTVPAACASSSHAPSPRPLVFSCSVRGLVFSPAVRFDCVVRWPSVRMRPLRSARPAH